MDGVIRIKRKSMTLADIIATVGITILLIAFILNSINLIAANKPFYNLLNIIGAALCGISAYMISFYPFVVLEAVWSLVALIALIMSVSRETPEII